MAEERPPWPDPREVLHVFADKLREEASSAIERDQRYKAKVLRKHPDLSQRFKAHAMKRGHGYNAVYAVARQMDEWAERWHDWPPSEVG